jgi:acetylornithine deacetylase/succinyl-diaminopimelate desuccinylase-like protein
VAQPTGDMVIEDLRADRDELVSILQELVRCHPIYGSAGQEEVLRIAGQHLTEAGLAIRHRRVDLARLRRSAHYVDVTALGGDFAKYGDPPRSSIVGGLRFTDQGPDIVLNGHLDVDFVTSPQTWSEPELWSAGVVRHGRIYGRGASDMLGGVACYLYTLHKLSRYFDQARGQLSVELVLDEEIGGNGTLWELLDRQGPMPDVAIIAEPSDRTVCGVTRGFHQFAITWSGAPVHMAFAGEFVNANRALADVILLLEEFNQWVRKKVPAATGSRFVMYGRVRGGTDAAVPAEETEIDVTLALPPNLSAQEVQLRLQRQLNRLSDRLSCRISTRPYGLSFGGSSLTSPWLQRALLDTARAQGITLSLGEFPSACDARLFAAFGVPVVVYGPGSLTRAHASDEYVTVQELEEYCMVLAGTLLHAWSTGQPNWTRSEGSLCLRESRHDR